MRERARRSRPPRAQARAGTCPRSPAPGSPGRSRRPGWTARAGGRGPAPWKRSRAGPSAQRSAELATSTWFSRLRPEGLEVVRQPLVVGVEQRHPRLAGRHDPAVARAALAAVRRVANHPRAHLLRHARGGRRWRRRPPRSPPPARGAAPARWRAHGGASARGCRPGSPPSTGSGSDPLAAARAGALTGAAVRHQPAELEGPGGERIDGADNGLVAPSPRRRESRAREATALPRRPGQASGRGGNEPG